MWSMRSGKAPAVSAAEPMVWRAQLQGGSCAVVGWQAALAAAPAAAVGSMGGRVGTPAHHAMLTPSHTACWPCPCPATGAALITLLEAHPNLLTYAVSGDGKQLEKGQARASVDVVERGGRKVAGVSYWREGASFEGTPVAPYKPSAL